jgi:hypothetical protein
MVGVGYGSGSDARENGIPRVACANGLNLRSSSPSEDPSTSKTQVNNPYPAPQLWIEIMAKTENNRHSKFDHLTISTIKNLNTK